MKSNALVVRSWNGQAIQRRRVDNFVNATGMCNANGKHWPDYRRNDRCQSYLGALAETMGNPMDSLIESVPGRNGGTWVHPRVAVDLARWISPEFAVWMDGWLLEELETSAKPVQAACLLSDEEIGGIMDLLCEDVKAAADRLGAMVSWPTAEGLLTASECLDRLKRRVAMAERLLPNVKPLRRAKASRSAASCGDSGAP